MLKIIFALVALLILVVCISLHKTYHYVPAKELKRRAQTHDELAKILYKVMAYGGSIDILLWMLIGLSGATFFVLLSTSMAFWLALVAVTLVVWISFAFLPNARLTSLGVHLARYLSPPLAWLLERLHPVLGPTARTAGRLSPPAKHTGLFTREDLLEMLTLQGTQHDNRISEDELQIVGHALQFGQKTVSEVMTPKRMIVSVGAKDEIGPILMGELHQSGHSRFPVCDGDGDTFVGVLHTQDMLRAKAGGLITTVMVPEVLYMHQEQTLAQALQVFLKTKHHLFLVVNSFEEIVGLITIEDVIEQIIGQPIVDEFDKYEDLRAVAARTAAKIHKEQKHESLPPEPPEVVE